MCGAFSGASVLMYPCRLGNEEVKSILQPMFEIMAVAELASFENELVPLVNIMGNKTAFRPILYWRKLDIIITTPDVVPLRRNNETLDVQGLLLLFVLFQLNYTSIISFNREALKKHSKTGWAQALAAGEDNYRHSKITLPTQRLNLVHQDAIYGTVSDSESEDEVSPPPPPPPP